MNLQKLFRLIIPNTKNTGPFQQKFGDDGNVLVVGVQIDKFFTLSVFNAYSKLHRQLRQVQYVEDVLSVPGAIALQKDPLTDKLIPVKIFPDSLSEHSMLDSASHVFKKPFFL